MLGKGQQFFGGDWTEEKLTRVRKYLTAYMKIFSTNLQAKYLTPIYVDAFAGTGYRATRTQSTNEELLFPELREEETIRFLKGSARIALEINPSFAEYKFIEQDLEYQKELEQLKKDFPSIAERITILPGDANKHLRTICEQTNWRNARAVFFLDPYGMEVEWTTIESIAKTRAADLWLLFPLGIGVTRLLTKRQPPTSGWANRLTKIFGTDTWEKVFYSEKIETTLFGDKTTYHREANWNQIGKYFVDRLKTIFIEVAENPLILRNSKNSPLYFLCFAASNPKGAKTAIKIAQNILE